MCNHELRNTLKDVGLSQTSGMAQEARYGQEQSYDGQKSAPEKENIVMAGGGARRVPSYTPSFVSFCISLYVSPDTLQRIKFGNISTREKEALKLLERAGILALVPNPEGWDSPTGYQIDEDALRVYIDALCCVSLPEKKWVMP